MQSLVLDNQTRATLQGKTGILQLCDPDGHIIGYFTPASDLDTTVYDDFDIPELTDQELSELKNQPRGRPLSDILADLETRQP